MSLKEYQRKRQFHHTPEPRGKKNARKTKLLRFVVQKHAATRTHYDFRLELEGVLKSWAVPKGPSLLSREPRLAVHVEDHPLEYGSFEGIIPQGNYGAGTVMVWDRGTYVERRSQGRKDSEEAMRQGLTKGHLTFILHGKKLRGEFALVRLKGKKQDNSWLLIKKQDAEASRRDILEDDRSVLSGRSMEEIAAEATQKKQVWLSRKTRKPPEPTRVGKPSSQLHSAMPRRIPPMVPVFTTSPPQEQGWVFEPFGRGSRAIAEIEPNRVQLYSRALLPLAKKYVALTESLKRLDHAAILDGEIVREGKKEAFIVSDLLYLDGEDLRHLPLKDRKEKLSRLRLRPPLKLSESLSLTSLRKSLPKNAPFVAKRLSASYRSGLTRDWLWFKVKTALKPSLSSHDKPPLTHLNKIFWPEEGYTKGDLVNYYDKIANVLLPYLIDRPQSLHRQPDGIRGEGFFHKDMSSFLPRRIQTVRIVSGSAGRTINYLLCQDRWSLLYLVNLGCIELNPWLSRRPHLDKPDMVVIDIDPDGNDFTDVIKVARRTYQVLKAINAKSFCKTSGATGLHICIPTGARYDYDTARAFAEKVCRLVQRQFPQLTSLEREPHKRLGRIYLDFLQNRRGQTLAAPYCVRPRPLAPVSTPLRWSELKPGLKPEAFNLKTIARRLARMGDLWKPMLELAVDLEACMERLSKHFHI